MGNLFPFQTRPSRRAHPAARAQRGMGILQLLGMLGALMALVVGLSYKTSDYFSKSQALDSDALLRLADNQLRQYVAANGRLPCPDLDGNGAAASSCADVSKQKGYLPYLTLGMAEKNYVYGEVPILYGVYNDGGDVDTGINFSSSDQVFFPAYADKDNAKVKVGNPRNIFDFCLTLERLQSKTGTPGVTELSIARQSRSVYALALPGRANRDGLSAGWTGGPSINAQYDGLNALNAYQFELSEKQIDPTYDDRTFFRGPTDLHDYFRCKAMNNSIGLLVDAVTIQKEVEDYADANNKDALKGLILNSISIAIAAWELSQTIADAAEASEQIGIAAGLLATASATCPIPPWVSCALIPVYATSLSSASIGLGLSVGAAVAAATGIGLSIAATVLYADIKQRTSSADAAPPPPPSSPVTAADLATKKTAYLSSKATAVSKRAAGAAADALKANVDNAAATLNADIAAVTSKSGSLGGLLNGILNGSAVTCDPASHAGCVAVGSTNNVTTYSTSTTTYCNLDPQTDCLAAGYTAKTTTTYSKNGPDGIQYCDGSASAAAAATCLANGYAASTVTTYSKTVTDSCLLGEAACLAAGYTKLTGPEKNAGGALTLVDKDLGLLTCGTPPAPLDSASCAAAGYSDFKKTVTWTKSALAAPYYPGIVPALDSYYQAKSPQPQADGTPSTVDATAVADALSAANAVVSAYSNLLSNIKAFDQANLDAYQAAVGLAANAALLATANAKLSTYNTYVATHCGTIGCAVAGVTYDAGYAATSQSYLDAYSTAKAAYDAAVLAAQVADAARATALSNLQTAMGTGYGSWDYQGQTSLCGSSSVTSACGWTNNGSAANAASDPKARTVSLDVNAYLAAYEAYKNTDVATVSREAATTLATAWADRNKLKTALCSVADPAATAWYGGATPSNPDPATWDLTETVNTATWSGSPLSLANVGALDCTATPPAPGTPSSKTKSTIQGAELIVNTLIKAGVSK